MDQYIGKMLDNRYEILERIGTGGMAVVYKAKCHRLNRLVAVKILKADLAQDEDFRRRFNAESQAVAQLSHPNIVSVYDVSRGGDTEYIVMELIDGITLKQYMEKRGQLNWRESLHFITQIMRGLSHAHSRGIVHRDIKPQNIMVLRDGSVKVADFGIACLENSAQTLTRLAELLTAKEKEFGHDIWLISDEPYREIVFDGKDIPYVSRFYPRTLSCYSFSKSLSLPGDRIGYVAVNPASGVSKMLATMCGQISRGIGHNCPTALMQLAVADCCDMTADLSVYETNMNLLYDELTRLGFEIVRPGGTFYMFPKALEADAVAFSKKALRYDLILVPGDSFGAPGYFRIAYCVGTDKVKRSLEAFRRFVKAEY